MSHKVTTKWTERVGLNKAGGIIKFFETILADRVNICARIDVKVG